jgi:hypothetical protein
MHFDEDSGLMSHYCTPPYSTESSPTIADCHAIMASIVLFQLRGDVPAVLLKE